MFTATLFLVLSLLSPTCPFTLHSSRAFMLPLYATSKLDATSKSTAPSKLAPILASAPESISASDFLTYLSSYRTPTTLPIPYNFYPDTSTSTSFGTLSPTMPLPTTVPTELSLSITQSADAVTSAAVTITATPANQEPSFQGYTTQTPSPTDTISNLVTRTLEFAMKDIAKFALAPASKIKARLKNLPPPIGPPATITPSSPSTLTAPAPPPSTVTFSTPVKVAPPSTDIFAPPAKEAAAAKQYAAFTSAADLAADSLLSLTPSPFLHSATNATAYFLPSNATATPPATIRAWLRLHKLSTLSSQSSSPLIASIYTASFTAMLGVLKEDTDLNQFARLLAHDLYATTMKSYLANPPDDCPPNTILTRVNTYAMDVVGDIVAATGIRQDGYSEVVREICQVVMADAPPEGITLEDKFRDTIRDKSRALGADFLGFLTAKIKEEKERIAGVINNGVGYDDEFEEESDQKWVQILELIARVVRDVVGGGEVRDNVEVLAMALRFDPGSRLGFLGEVLDDMAPGETKSLEGTIEDVFRNGEGSEAMEKAGELAAIYNIVGEKRETGNLLVEAEELLYLM